MIFYNDKANKFVLTTLQSDEKYSIVHRIWRDPNTSSRNFYSKTFANAKKRKRFAKSNMYLLYSRTRMMYLIETIHKKDCMIEKLCENKYVNDVTQLTAFDELSEFFFVREIDNV